MMKNINNVTRKGAKAMPLGWFALAITAVMVCLSGKTVAQTPVPMALQQNLTYTEDFTDIANWANGFTSGIGANRWLGNPTGGSATIPDPTRITAQTQTFSTGSTGGAQRGTGNLQFLSTGSTDNSSSTAVDFFADFAGVNAGTLSFNWECVFNSTGNRVGSLRVYASVNGVTWLELTGTTVVCTNNVAANGAVTNIQLPAIFDNSSTARLRFYYWNGGAAVTSPTGSRPKIAIDNVSITATQPAIPPTNLTLQTTGTLQIGTAVYQVTTTMRDANGIPRPNTSATTVQYTFGAGVTVSGPSVSIIPQGQTQTTATFTLTNSGNNTTIPLTVSATGLTSTSAQLFAPGVNFNTPPTVIPAGSLSIALGDPTNLTTTCTYSDTEQNLSSLVISATSSNQTVIPNGNIVITNTGNGVATFAFTPVGSGLATITVSAFDGFATGTATFTVGVSPAGSTSTRYHHGVSDASAAIALDDNTMLVADDENQTIRMYRRNNSGFPIAQFDFTANLALTDLDAGVPREVDIEGVTRVGNRLYWLASHSNSSGNASRPNRNRIFATDIVGTGTTATLQFVGFNANIKNELLLWDALDIHGKGANFYNLGAAATAGATNFFPEDNQGRGFNIEGFCMAPNSTTTAYVGFRAPIVPPTARTKALVVPIVNMTDVAISSTATPIFGAPIELDLGGRGIRSMENNGSVIVIVAGPVSDAPVPPLASDFRLYTWSGNPNDAPQLRTANLTGLVPEAIVSLPAGNLSSTTAIQLVSDNGDTQWYGDGQISKTYPLTNLRKFRSDVVLLGDITTAGNPLPGLYTVTPNVVEPTTASVAITVTGINFLTTSTLRFDGANLATTYVNATTLTAVLAPSQVNTERFALITVFNPAPEGGTSGTLPFFVQGPQASGLELQALGTPAIINFDQSSRSANSGQLSNVRFSTLPFPGELDSRAWALALESGTMAFEGTYTGSGVLTGGTGSALYAVDIAPNNRALGIQPAGSFFSPGSITLRVVNNTGVAVTTLSVSYNVYAFNDRDRGNSFNFSHSTNNTTYVNETSLNYTSPANADAIPAWVQNARSILLNVNIPPGGFYFLRWFSNDVTGSGERDEFALDDIRVIPNPTPDATRLSLTSATVSTGNGTATYNITVKTVDAGGVERALTQQTSVRLTVSGEVNGSGQVVQTTIPANVSQAVVQLTLSTTGSARIATITGETFSGAVLESGLVQVNVPGFQAPVPVSLAFTAGIPQNVNTNTAFSPISVRIRDQFGNTIAATGNITLTLTNSTHTITLVEDAVNGVATFAGVVLSTTGTWNVQATLPALGLTAAQGTLEVAAFGSQNINLVGGWNLVSSFIQASNPSFAAIAPSATSFVLAKDYFGSIYAPTLGVTTLQTWNTFRGYQIFANGSSTLTLSGIRVPESTPITLQQGWNLISYLKNSSMTPAQAFASVPGLVLVRNQSGLYFPALNLSTLTQVQAGEGYYVFVSQPSNFTYPASIKASVAEPTILPSVTPVASETENMASMIVRSALPDGTELLVRGEKSSVVARGIMQNGYAVLTLWGESTMLPSSQAHIAEGEYLSISAVDARGEMPLDIRSATSVLTNQETDVRFTSGEALLVDATPAISANAAISVSPNPVRNEAVVRFTLPVAQDVSVKLYNALGQEVATLFNGSIQSATLPLNATILASGTYRLVIVTTTETLVQSVVITK